MDDFYLISLAMVKLIDSMRILLRTAYAGRPSGLAITSIVPQHHVIPLTHKESTCAR
jgi:hypothetical protein